MTYETVTALPPEEVLRRAKEFFASRVPATGAFVERESERHLVLRGQGGEEVVFAVTVGGEGSTGEGTRVRGSSLLFDQQIQRFYSTLPEHAPAAEAP